MASTVASKAPLIKPFTAASGSSRVENSAQITPTWIAMAAPWGAALQNHSTTVAPSASAARAPLRQACP